MLTFKSFHTFSTHKVKQSTTEITAQHLKYQRWSGFSTDPKVMVVKIILQKVLEVAAGLCTH
jgi:hypothetical protein